ncbi:RNA methyltransferase [Streptomyces clavuligerus]|uniref:rRNA methylase n=1 Tax=Streptomyces clavuligerus TaxID=1901 RepID=E2QA94_STRCL|nr:RNA methyltransferase [Streptomyces clavuligerus]ANW17683.1 rRNA methyltransferase [Streptomyces clavuligerus]AXU12233.1 TrmH family RNA methyltransferase [Streptomyces clavuligerus]EFG09793.1 rRNA methylase [Streptomyces clavuligerus]MBY6302105.1 RNA methyltransferase [Streptomyces clavuligerus]QCS05015.1 TrmH family RNA methyltransferase [Streptomyces clavuligerus]
MHQLRGTELKRLHRSWKRQSSAEVALLLENVQSPFNVGSIVRTAAALGVGRLYLAGNTASPRNAKAQKICMGTDRYLDVQTFETLPEAVERVRADGYRLVGLELADEAVPLHEADLSGATCIAVGNEDHGISPQALGMCDAVAFIPQLGRVGSLNVATALAVACYEVRRQDWAGLPADA